MIWIAVGLGVLVGAVGWGFPGALVLGVVDLSHVGGIERIASFIAVGVLMLVIGYLSPVLPRTPQNAP
ncbi:MAG: hypothetical protein ACXWAC_02160 [Usitatibacter sp.]